MGDHSKECGALCAIRRFNGSTPCGLAALLILLHFVDRASLSSNVIDQTLFLSQNFRTGNLEVARGMDFVRVRVS
jgi:hypothetical protein